GTLGGVRAATTAAGTARGRNRTRSVAALGRSSGVGLAGLDDLLLVLLEAGLRLGVLGLPHLTLGFEALEPVVGLGVEALGVDVVALVVVRRGHAVQRRVEVDRRRVGTEG